MAVSEPRRIGLGLLGCGHVGSAVARLLHAHAEDIVQRAGARLEIVKVAVRNAALAREVPLPAERFTADAASVVSDPDVEIVVEVMGGVEPARSLLLQAITGGKHVVTANKELVSTLGRELFEAADAARVDLYFEGAVGGGIPLIHPLKESLAGERVATVLGIVNGTTNYVLTRMSEDQLSFEEALGQAERLGYAERDPSDDIEGADAAAKCAILASVAFNTAVVAGDVYREGIARVTAEDIAFAARLGYVIKLLAIAELEDGEVAVRVHPAMIPTDHPLAAVRDTFNAVFVQGPTVGELMFYGRGAGGGPTATAVVGDVVDVARNLLSGARGVPSTTYLDRPLRPMERMEGQYYLLLDVVDRPGVLAQVAGAFGRHAVSIKSVWQEGFGDEALLVMITHRANEGALQRTVRDLRDLEVVAEVRSVMRVEGAEP
ncbi:MAG TPA: homoserine dehydrogenase [Actinomycetota bacterium]|nr:homoserine dehydrogenase [Actinomycetota bacterium]